MRRVVEQQFLWQYDIRLKKYSNCQFLVVLACLQLQVEQTSCEVLVSHREAKRKYIELDSS
jgi:hypothetical protein